MRYPKGYPWVRSENDGFDMGHVHSNKELSSVRIHILVGCQDRHRGGRRDVRPQIETDEE